MAGNVESELRQAMADQVADVAAPRSLAHDVVRRHRRRVVRTRLLVAASVAVVAAAGGLPAYQALAPDRLNGPGRPGVDVAGTATPLPTPTGSSSSAPGPGGAPRPRAPQSSDPSEGGGGGPARQGSRNGSGVRLGYLPAGLRQDGGCETQKLAGRETTSCRWTGGSGLNRTWVDIKVIRGPGISRADDLGFPAARTEETRVGGERALLGFRPDGSRQVVWTARTGVGVYVAAGGSAGDDLIKIANGIRVAG